MVFFEWNDKLQTGIEIIDNQHRRLIDLVNELNEAMRNKKGKEALGHVLSELKDYTNYHFKYEEKEFEKFGYPQSEVHKKEHDDLIRQVEELIGQFQKDRLGISIDVLDFLTKWVKNHIMKEDMMYVPFLKDKDLDRQ
jgi:hemerythrin-like metal-binding protein